MMNNSAVATAAALVIKLSLKQFAKLINSRRSVRAKRIDDQDLNGVLQISSVAYTSVT
jgi:hypothetical protein